MNKVIATFLILALIFSLFIPFNQTPFSPQKAYAETCIYNIGNQLTTNDSINYASDKRGNQTGAGTRTYSFNFENRLTQFINEGTTTQYTYDGKNIRLSQKVGNVTTQFVNDVSDDLTKVLVAKNTSNNTSNYFVQGPEVVSEGGATSISRQYYIYDGLGNIRFVTDSAGNKLQSFSYDPYGNSIGTSNGSAFKYKGEQIDQAGLYFMRARYYDPTIGRFISRDPIKGTLTNPQTQNPYAYAGNNPINNNDPGRKFYPESAVLGGGLTLSELV